MTVLKVRLIIKAMYKVSKRYFNFLFKEELDHYLFPKIKLRIKLSRKYKLNLMIQIK